MSAASLSGGGLAGPRATPEVVEPWLFVEHRLHFLTDGAPELPEHRQTLRNTIA